MTPRLDILFAGSSFTISGISYSVKVTDWLHQNYPEYKLTTANQAQGGCKTWFNLAILGRYLTPDIKYVIIDTANDQTASVTKDAASLEAFIRRVQAYNSAIKIIGISAPSWITQDTSDNSVAPTPITLPHITAAKAIFEHYGCNYVAYHDEVVTLVPGTYDLIDLVADTVHPTDAGYQVMAGLVQEYLPSGGASLPSTLPAVLDAATPDFEHEPTLLNGTDFDSRTGTWADSGTSTSSSNVGATITYSFTGRSFGIYRADATYPDIEVSIDGGAYASITADRNGYDLDTRAAHTVTIKVLTTVKIDEFWVI